MFPSACVIRLVSARVTLLFERRCIHRYHTLRDSARHLIRCISTDMRAVLAFLRSCHEYCARSNRWWPLGCPVGWRGTSSLGWGLWDRSRVKVACGDEAMQYRQALEGRGRSLVSRIVARSVSRGAWCERASPGKAPHWPFSRRNRHLAKRVCSGGVNTPAAQPAGPRPPSARWEGGRVGECLYLRIPCPRCGTKSH